MIMVHYRTWALPNPENEASAKKKPMWIYTTLENARNTTTSLQIDVRIYNYFTNYRLSPPFAIKTAIS